VGNLMAPRDRWFNARDLLSVLAIEAQGGAPASFVFGRPRDANTRPPAATGEEFPRAERATFQPDPAGGRPVSSDRRLPTES